MFGMCYKEYEILDFLEKVHHGVCYYDLIIWSVNGTTNEFKFERGLRQGGPFCPFLFLLADESLNIMKNTTVEAGLFSGYKVSLGGSVNISHLQFVHDCSYSEYIIQN